LTDRSAPYEYRPSPDPSGYAPAAYPTEAYATEAYATEAYAPEAYAPDGYAPPGYPAPTYPPAGYPGPTYPTAGYPPAGYPATGSALDGSLLITVATWTVAAVLAIVAPFLQFWQDSFPDATGGPTFVTRSTGWGGLSYSGGSGGDPLGSHHTQYGILMIAAAALLLIAIVSLLTNQASRTAYWPRITGLVGCGVLVVTAALAGLDATSRLSYNDTDSTEKIQIGVWLLLISAIIAVIGAIGAATALRRLRVPTTS
jgi:hypothetical protein